MSQRIVPALATFLGICAFISITMYSVYLNAVPQYIIVCSGCSPGENCSCNATEDPNLWGMVQKINWLTLIAYMAMYILLCYAIGIIVERWLTYYYAERQTREFTSKMSAAIYGNRIDEAKSLAADYPKSPLAAVVNVSLHPTEAYTSSDGLPSMEARHHAMVVKTAELKQGLWNLSAAGWTVPLLGFLIMVVAVVSMLHGAMYAEGNLPPYLAGRCADALWATIFSLLFGIPVIWFHKYFTAKFDTLSIEMERRSIAILSQIASPPNALMACDAVRQYDTQPLAIRATHGLRH